MGKEKSIFRELFTELQQTNIMYISLISICLLIIIDYLNPTGRVMVELWGSTVVIGMLISFWFVINNKILLLFKVNSINALDDINLYIVISDLGYGLYLLITKQYFSWKFVVVLLIALLSLSIGIYRIICLQQAILKRLKNDEECHLVELKDLYKNNLNVSLPIFIKDRAVKDDLLGRDSIITLLYKSICQNFSKQDSFVIGLSGPWGSGKTTITNIVRKQLEEQNSDIKIIRGLNPWISGSEVVLLNSFYDAMLNALGINYSSRKIRKQLKEVSRYVIEIPTVGKSLSKVMENDINQENIEKWQANLKNLILSSNKKYVLFIDDLDRATSTQIRFLLKMLGSLFDLPNLIFILLYDRNRLEKILQDDNKLNTSFAEKVINLELQVPKVSENSVQKIYRSCLINLARIYNVSDKEVNNLDSAFQLIIKSIDNPREFIRFMNSICYIAFSPDINLNRNDLLLIEYISFKQPDLFQLIKENPKLFVSENSELDISDVFNLGKLKIEIYGFYSKVLKNKYSRWLAILEVLFPYIEQCQMGKEHLQINNNSNEGRKNNRIYDGHNFDLYFSLSEDYILGKNKKIKDIVDKLKEKFDNTQIEKLKKEIFEGGKANVSENIHLFSMYKNEFNSVTGVALSKVILENMEKIPENGRAFVLSARKIAASICVNLLRDAQKEKISELLEKYITKYELIDVFDNLYTFSKNYKNVHEISEIIWNSMCTDIIKDNIDLYKDQYYHPNLIWNLYRGMRGTEEEKNKIISAYLRTIATKNNVYRIFYDFMSISHSNEGIDYIFKEENRQILEKAQLEKILPAPINISQKIIFDIYSKGPSDDFDYKYKDTEISIGQL